MTVYGRILIATLGSGALLLAALGFQYLGGLAPCPLCVWQRWPHVAAVALGLLAVTVLWRLSGLLAALGAAAMGGSAGLALYHVGIERDWWAGPAACGAPGLSGRSPEALLDEILTTPVVRCDEVAWEFLGISMAGWNGLASLALGAVWLWSAIAPPRVAAP